jgi:glycosyltransferase involved in cell wall biosynthesis
MLFSIITICRNNIGELEKTHKSILQLANMNYEWLVIDGDSSDGTRDWLENHLENKYWISEPDEGIYNAMNKGISLAHGEYLVFMNSGDEFYDGNVLDRIEQVIGSEEERPAFIYGDSVDVAEDGTEYYRKAKKYNAIKFGMITQHQAMFFKRELLPSPPYPEQFKLSADYALISHTLKHSPENGIVQVDFPICRFKMGGTNESKRFLALKEDYAIRKNIQQLTALEAAFLYFLHYNHAMLKHLFKRSRFLRHKEIKEKV